MKYKVEIDRNGCIACATCYTIDPSHFESDPDGKSKVVCGVSNGKSTGTFADSSCMAKCKASHSISQRGCHPPQPTCFSNTL